MIWLVVGMLIYVGLVLVAPDPHSVRVLAGAVCVDAALFVAVTLGHRG